MMMEASIFSTLLRRLAVVVVEGAAAVTLQPQQLRVVLIWATWTSSDITLSFSSCVRSSNSNHKCSSLFCNNSALVTHSLRS